MKPVISLYSSALAGYFLDARVSPKRKDGAVQFPDGWLRPSQLLREISVGVSNNVVQLARFQRLCIGKQDASIL